MKRRGSKAISPRTDRRVFKTRPKTHPWVDKLSEQNPQALLAVGLNDAIIGIANRAGHAPVMAYSYEKALDVLMETNGWTGQDAQEWMESNVVCAGMGEHSPVFVDMVL